MALGDDRRASGRAMEAQREALGPAMEQRRRGTTVEDLNAVVKPVSRKDPLPEVPKRGGVPAGSSTAPYQAPPSTGSGGISGPLVEVKDSRVYYDDRVSLYSNDYLMAVEVRPLKSLTFTDGSGATFQMQFAQPKMES